MPIGSLKRDILRDHPNYCLAFGASNMRDPVLITFCDILIKMLFHEASGDFSGLDRESDVL